MFWDKIVSDPLPHMPHMHRAQRIGGARGLSKSTSGLSNFTRLQPDLSGKNQGLSISKGHMPVACPWKMFSWSPDAIEINIYRQLGTGTSFNRIIYKIISQKKYNSLFMPGWNNLYVCECMCVIVCVWLYMCVSVYVWLYMCDCICVIVSVWLYVWLYVCDCMCVILFVIVCVWLYVCDCMCVIVSVWLYCVIVSVW